MQETTHRRSAGHGQPSGFTWTSPDGQLRLRIPWRDLLENGRPSDERFITVAESLHAFDRAVADPEMTETPPMPTPHAEFVEIDDAAFEAELAERLIDYKDRMAGAHG